MYYPCSENKGADQLRGYREADLRLCFRIGKNPVFSRCGSFSTKSDSNQAELSERFQDYWNFRFRKNNSNIYLL